MPPASRENNDGNISWHYLTSISVKYWITIVDEYYATLRGPLQLLNMTPNSKEVKINMMQLNIFPK